MNSITVRAPAKVNLYLKVLSKRKDSYHNIHTLFEQISLADTVKITKIPKGIIVKSDAFITKKQEDNIAYKAASAILRYAKVKSGVRIYIKKKIPIAAGLGGGSSDAAAVLKGINSLFKLKLDDKTLMRLGGKTGADVPFFISGASFAVGKGKGGDISPIKTPLRLWHLLVFPGFKIATKEVYRAFDEASFVLTPKLSNAKMILPSNKKIDYAMVEALLHNDLENTAMSKKKVLGDILRGLEQLLGKVFIVSGSGPSLFCLYRTGKEAIFAKAKVSRNVPAGQRRGWQIFVVQTS